MIKYEDRERIYHRLVGVFPTRKTKCGFLSETQKNEWIKNKKLSIQ